MKKSPPHVICLFFHIGKLGKYEEIFSEMYRAVVQCGLLERLDYLYLMHYGDGPIDFPTQSEKIKVIQGPLIQPTSEFITMTHIKRLAHQFASNGQKAYIGYIHTKGTFTPDVVGRSAITDWRRYMQHFVIERHEEVFQLLAENDTVGVDLKRHPGLHYSGNFWWSTSDYLSTLPDFIQAEILGMPSIRHRAEFYITSNMNARHFSMWDSGIDVYERRLHEYPPERYRHGVVMTRWGSSTISRLEAGND